jgi:purine-binding chemotaxis protein CheW
MAGVVNLRGTMIPMIDLRPRLGLPPAEIDPSQVFLVGAARGRTVGVLADRVDDVVEVPGGTIDPTDEAGDSEGLVTGFARSADGAMPILDLEGLVQPVPSGAWDG